MTEITQNQDIDSKSGSDKYGGGNERNIVRESVRVPCLEEYLKPNIVINEDILQSLHRWGSFTLGNERRPDSYTITFVDEKWMKVEAKWEMNEVEYDNYRKYCTELDAKRTNH